MSRDINTDIQHRTELDKGNTVILGIDIGTSGVRGCLVSVNKPAFSAGGVYQETLLSECCVTMPMPEKTGDNGSSMQNPQIWTLAFKELFLNLAKFPDFKRLEHIVADATSSTVLLCTPQGEALTQALMYDDQQAQSQATEIESIVKKGQYVTAATGPNSTLAKCLFLIEQVQQRAKTNPTQTLSNQPITICHQIDWFNFWLTGQLGYTDENNALKLGYDSIKQAWPNWVVACLQQKTNSAGLVTSLPKVLKPGEVISSISSLFAKKWNLSQDVKVHAGTTDSIAGFLASGAHKVGDAVSSLGSTLAVKLVSEKPIFNRKYGVYSHRLGTNWLVGGASNSGGAVLLHYFNLAQIKHRIALLEGSKELEGWLNQDNPDYYPLINTGERFPIADPQCLARLPIKKPDSDEMETNQFFVAIIQGLANVESLSYKQLESLQASPLKRLFSVGGGTKNPIWMHFRKKYLKTQFSKADSLDAAFGVTRIVSHYYKP